MREQENLRSISPMVRRTLETPVKREGYIGAEIVEMCSPLRDSIGLYHDWVTSNPVNGAPDYHGSGNAISYTADVAIVLWNNSQKHFKVWRPFMKTTLYALEKCKVFPNVNGFYKRHPKFYSTDQISHDDLIGLCTISAMNGGRIAGEVCEFGDKGFLTRVTVRSLIKCLPTPAHKLRDWLLAKLPLRFLNFGRITTVKWYFPNEEVNRPEFHHSAWIFRFVSAVHHIRKCASLSSSMLASLVWAISILRAKNSNDLRLAWQMTQTPRHFNAIEKWAVERFLRKNNIGKILKDYFRWDHPLCRFADLKLNSEGTPEKYTGIKQ